MKKIRSFVVSNSLLAVFYGIFIHNVKRVDAGVGDDGDDRPDFGNSQGYDRDTHPDVSRILPTLSMILTTIAVYYVYRFCSWYGRIRRVGRQVDKLPGDKAHWLFGNLLEVDVQNIEVQFWVEK